MEQNSASWLSFVKYIVRDYPTLCAELDALRNARDAVDSVSVYRGSFARPVEAKVVRELPPDKQKELDAVRTAIDLTMAMHGGELRMKLIEAAYWVKPRPLSAAAAELHLSYRTAKRYSHDFMEAAARAYGIKIS